MNLEKIYEFQESNMKIIGKINLSFTKMKNFFLKFFIEKCQKKNLRMMFYKTSFLKNTKMKNPNRTFSNQKEQKRRKQTSAFNVTKNRP